MGFTTRNVDITMLQMLNTQERSAEDWQEVVALADPRLKILGIHKPSESWDSLIEIGFA
jgi:6-hydroxytryprostatin B O-methyltransferase